MSAEEVGYNDEQDPFWALAVLRWQTQKGIDKRHANLIGSEVASAAAWFLGIHGELAFVNDFYSYGARLEMRNLPKGDRGKDAVIGPYRIDVKANKYNGGALLVEAGKVFSDLFVLVHYKRFSEVVGWATREEVLEQEPQRWPTDVKNHVIELADLRPPWQLHETLEAIT